MEGKKERKKDIHTYAHDADTTGPPIKPKQLSCVCYRLHVDVDVPYVRYMHGYNFGAP